MEARQRTTLPSADDVAVAQAPAERPARRRAGGTATRPSRTVPRPVLTKEQEYAYIRSDLRRLLVIAGPLLVAMIALLFVLGAWPLT